jgi:DNA-directed RNA polymerase beta' subunit
MLSKRIELSARTVISPEINNDIDEVGIPIAVLKNLTIPE